MNIDDKEEIMELYNNLKQLYPHGHPKFIDITLRELKLHSDKNYDYASGGNPMGNFNRVSSILGLYPGLKLSQPIVVCLTYALKQLDAVLWSLSRNEEGKVEGNTKRLEDVSVYTKIAQILNDEN